MINLSRFCVKQLKQTVLLNSYNKNMNMFNIISRSYISTSKGKTTFKNEKLDLKEEFQEMLKETQISEEEVKNKKKEESRKKKETMEQANKEWEKKNESLRSEWEKKRNSIDDDKEEELKLSNVKDKIKETLKFSSKNKDNKSDVNEKTEDTQQEQQEQQAQPEKENKNSKNRKDKKNKNESETKEEGPNVFSRFVTKFATVWKQTFPGEENLDLLLEKRKMEAQILKSKIKEATEDEIAEIEASIPEWKRGAIVLVETEAQKETYSIFDVAKRNLALHVKNLKIYQETQKSFKGSEVAFLLDDFKKSYSNVKENIKESQNPLFVVSRDLIDKVSFKSPSSQAISIMRKFDPSFELLDFEKEVNAIFKQLMHAFFKDDLDLVRHLTAEGASAILTSEIKSRRERNIELKYKELLYIDRAEYSASNVIDEDTVILRFRIQCQEINCKISRKDGKVIEGDEGLVLNVHYIIDITRNPTPVVEEVGHHYVIVGLERVGVTRQIL